MLMASRAKAPVLSASQPAAAPAPAPGEEEAAHKREADAMDDAPSAKRARAPCRSRRRPPTLCWRRWLRSTPSSRLPPTTRPCKVRSKQHQTFVLSPVWRSNT